MDAVVEMAGSESRRRTSRGPHRDGLRVSPTRTPPVADPRCHESGTPPSWCTRR